MLEELVSHTVLLCKTTLVCVSQSTDYQMSCQQTGLNGDRHARHLHGAVKLERNYLCKAWVHLGVTPLTTAVALQTFTPFDDNESVLQLTNPAIKSTLGFLRRVAHVA